MSSLLHGAYDLHMHCAPDVVDRAAECVDVVEAAREAGMAGLLLKDHTGSTVAHAWHLNRRFGEEVRVLSSLVLNPPVGGLNPCAVDAALRLGVDFVFFPTYSARYQLATLGPDGFPPSFPRPRDSEEGLSILDSQENIRREVVQILDLIAEHNVVLGTGHLSPEESELLIEEAVRVGVRRMIVTHASEPVPGMSVAVQQKLAEQGAFIEHSLMATTECCKPCVAWDSFCQQIRAVGVSNVIVSSDFGQVANGPPVAGFGLGLERLLASGFSRDEVRTMVCENPPRLVEGRDG